MINQPQRSRPLNSFSKAGRAILLATVLGCVAPALPSVRAQSAADAATNEVRIVELLDKVEVCPVGATTWVLTQTNQLLHPFDRLRTGARGRAALRWSDQSVITVGPLTEIEILKPHAEDAQSALNLVKGILSFFHRDKPGRIRIITRGAVAGIEGTELVIAVDPVNNTERTTLSVIEGRVRFTNDFGAIVLTDGEQAVAEPGQAPMRTAGFVANNTLQWCFYYPAVLDLRDLPLTTEEQRILGDSLEAYRAGDLLTALGRYPAARQPGSDAERVYYAALLLSVGQVEPAEAALAALPAGNDSARLARLAAALRQLIAAVKRQPVASAIEVSSRDSAERLSTELLAASYYEQSLGDRKTALDTALTLAREAATNSPEFGFAWERVAELEFSFGRTDRALAALDKSLALSPRNAQALALKGFLLAAQNKTREAIDWFDRAIAADSALGNAWLGRGLCRIRRGDLAGGREDLLVAAALEPQRAELRSYLGKAFADAHEPARAAKELDLAKKLDPNDPTAWLYSALLDQQYNRINEGIRDLEKSQELNENRSVYRSGLLLDQDRAVRSANLANIYRDDGMIDLSVREASRAVSYDYANYSAHLFLANSYDQLRDPNRINLRYETPAESEYLIANLLAPVGAGTLSQSISQQDYSKLFERDRFGVVSSSEYLSRGAWTERGAQYGTFGNSAYSFEGFFRNDPGQRPNNDFEETELHLQLKQQLTPQDTVYFRAIYRNSEGGDVIQYSDPSQANTGLRTTEKELPILSLGYHHEWDPGVHTLMLANWLNDDFKVANPTQPTLFIIKEDGVTPSFVQPMTIDQTFHGKVEIYSTELQQIWQQTDHSTVVGTRFQIGNFHTRNLQTNPDANDSNVFFDPDAPAAQQSISSDFDRWSLYGYHYWQLLPAVQIVGGVTYDWMRYPENFNSAPISNGEKTTDQVSPKAGFIWTPADKSVVRFAYTRSLAGANIDQTFSLEPSQVAGFNQSFRSILPESVSGAQAGAQFQTFNLGLEQRFGTNTYVGLSGQILQSKVNRTFGVFDFTGATAFAVPSGTPEHLDFVERDLLFTVNQLLGKGWSLAAGYRLTDADLKDNFTAIPDGVSVPPFLPRQNLSAILHQVSLAAIYNHPSGLFGEFQALWYHQSNHGYSPALGGDNFWQLNIFGGYRFARRRAELSVGVLNLTDQDYRLNPLTLYNELPRDRTFAVRFSFNF
jgi:Tfp pilus assembly protein PilF